MSAIDLNRDGFLADMITSTGKINTKALQSHFEFYSMDTVVKNPLYIEGGDKRVKKNKKVSGVLKDLRKKIKDSGPSSVILLIVRSSDTASPVKEMKEAEPEQKEDEQVDVVFGADDASDDADDAMMNAMFDEDISIDEIFRRIEQSPAPAPAPAPEPAETEGFTIQGLKRNLIQQTTGAKYLGSGTPLLKFLKDGERPEGEVDTIAMEHDIRYSTAISKQDVIDADNLFITRLNDLASRKASIGDIVLSFIAGPAMTLKRLLGSIPLSPLDTAYVDYGENASLPERGILLAIQEELADNRILTDESISFIFTPETASALELKEEADSAVTPTVTPDVTVDVTPAVTPAVTPTVTPTVAGRVAVPDLRAGHAKKVRQEQMLQALKKEDEDRKMGLIYQNNPDDYMAAPVPNNYMRPMFATQWLDIAKLQQYQTPEYVRAEKKIWERNWQTPFQFGEGTPDNSIKDIKNIVERLARLEHHIRYDYATKGLPADQVNTGFNYSVPMPRTGVIPLTATTEQERWRVYQRLQETQNMDKYQYTQRQNEPPRSKTINREAQQFKTTRDLQGQQKIYDEKMTEGLPHLDIQNDYDHIYYDRRIRRRQK